MHVYFKNNFTRTRKDVFLIIIYYYFIPGIFMFEINSVSSSLENNVED